jgi:hypothetical protein
MPVTRRIVILANSVKHDPGRCVAGREVRAAVGARLQAGPWIRPVSTVGEGELLQEHMPVADGGGINLLDIFEISLLARGNDPSQPENWIINAKTPWDRVGRWPANQLGKLVEAPANLWLQPHPVRSDRATPGYIQAHPPEQSLYLVVPTQARLYRNQWKKYRVAFNHADAHYDLGVTDPSVSGRLSGQTDVTLNAPTVCVSLAPAFKGYHYKVAATVIW